MTPPSVRLLAVVLAASMLALGAAPAAAQHTGEGLSARLALAPVALLERLKNSSSFADYVAQLRALRRRLDRGGDGLDQADIGVAERNAAAEARSRQLAEAFGYDLDGDGRIALGEVKTAAESEEAIVLRPPRPAAAGAGQFLILDMFDERGRDEVRLAHSLKMDPLSRIAVLDANHDDFVDFDEARRLAPGTVPDQSDARLIAQLIPMDPGHDGRLDDTDLRAIAAMIFVAFDLNGDGRRDDLEKAVLARHLPVDWDQPLQAGRSYLWLEPPDICAPMQPEAREQCRKLFPR